MTTTPVATAATGQPEWARCRGRGEQSLHCAFVARFPVVGSSKAGRIGLVYGRFSHQLEAHAAILLAPIPLIMGIIGALRIIPGTDRNNLATLTIHGRRAVWFSCSALAVMLPGRSRHSADLRRSAPTTGHVVAVRLPLRSLYAAGHHHGDRRTVVAVTSMWNSRPSR